MGKTWQKEVCAAASLSGDAANPNWIDVTPHCSERCPYHDGKRCELMGFRPTRLCEPVVREMGVKLSGGYAEGEEGKRSASAIADLAYETDQGDLYVRICGVVYDAEERGAARERAAVVAALDAWLPEGVGENEVYRITRGEHLKPRAEKEE